MIKPCKNCGKEFEGRPNKLHCSPKCAKDAEVLRRRAPKTPEKVKIGKFGKTPHNDLISKATKPDTLNKIASAYWDKIAPLLEQRGHLNVLSEDAFAELCDLHSRLVDIRAMIDAGTVQECKKCKNKITIPGNRSLLQLDDKWDNKSGTETQSFKESALSDLKRKYSARFLEYCKQFYLTPYSVRGNFGLEDKEKDGDALDRFIRGKNGK